MLFSARLTFVSDACTKTELVLLSTVSTTFMNDPVRCNTVLRGTTIIGSMVSDAMIRFSALVAALM